MPPYADAVGSRISDMAVQIASAVEEQNAVTSEISGNIEKIRMASDHLTGQAWWWICAA